MVSSVSVLLLKFHTAVLLWVGCNLSRFAMLALVCAVSVGTGSIAEHWGVRVPADVLNRTAAAHHAALKEALAHPATQCSIDMRDRIPTCKQQGADWCWATGLAEFSFWYNVSSGGVGNCTAVECAVVSMDHHMDCCPDGKIKCGADSATVAKVVNDATEFIGKPFMSRGGPPTEAELVELLQAGTPVMPIITWYKAGKPYGGHALMVSGCEAKSGAIPGVNYYLHDPEGTKYDTVSYERLMTYSAFNEGKWTDTVHAA